MGINISKKLSEYVFLDGLKNENRTNRDLSILFKFMRNKSFINENLKDKLREKILCQK